MPHGGALETLCEVKRPVTHRHCVIPPLRGPRVGGPTHRDGGGRDGGGPGGRGVVSGAAFQLGKGRKPQRCMAVAVTRRPAARASRRRTARLNTPKMVSSLVGTPRPS